MMNKKIILIGLLVAGIGIALIILIPFREQKKLYNRVMEERTLTRCDDYIYKYPDGRYLDEVLELKETLSYEKVLAEKQERFCDWYMELFPEGKHVEEVLYRKTIYAEFPFFAINEYLHRFPHGVYSDSVNHVCDLLWDTEINKYKNRDKKKESVNAVNYMMEMLQYMKKNRVNSIYVSVNPTIMLKDYDEYDKSKRELMEYLYSDERLPLKNNVISLKDNFEQGDLDILKKILSDGVQQSMDSMFTPGFIKVVCDEDKDKDDFPHLVFNYTIKNQEDDGYPHIWVYTETSTLYGRREIPQSYLVGININFNAEFSIPNSNVSYTFSEKGVPENNISGIDDISDGYRRMTKMCFAQFSNKMAKNMGLNETYFK